jgi:hypothetical protein
MCFHTAWVVLCRSGAHQPFNRGNQSLQLRDQAGSLNQQLTQFKD